MRIAYTMAAGRGDTDLLLAGLAERLAAAGKATCGTVQINTETGPDRPCHMDIKVLPDGPVLRISQSLGTASKGCRLDPNALEAAVGHAQARFDAGADAVIINKFGKHEAEGRGFRELIAAALEAEVPVLVGTNALNLPAFLDFTQGLAEALPPEPEALWDWFADALNGGA